MKKTNEFWNEALDLVIESVMKPDSEARHYAKEESCYEHLMTIRLKTISYLQTLRK